MTGMTNFTGPAHKGQAGEPGHAGHFAHATHTQAPSGLLTRPSRDENPSRYDVYRDDTPWLDAGGWERYPTEQPGSKFAPRFWETITEAEHAGELGNTYSIDPATGTVQRLMDTHLSDGHVQSDGPNATDWPENLDFHQQFDPAQDLYSENWEYNLADLVSDMVPGDTLIVQTQVVQGTDFTYDEYGNTVADCTCEDTHDEYNDDCDGYLADDLVGWALMAKIRRATS